MHCTPECRHVLSHQATESLQRCRLPRWQQLTTTKYSTLFDTERRCFCTCGWRCFFGSPQWLFLVAVTFPFAWCDAFIGPLLPKSRCGRRERWRRRWRSSSHTSVVTDDDSVCRTMVRRPQSYRIVETDRHISSSVQLTLLPPTDWLASSSRPPHLCCVPNQHHWFHRWWWWWSDPLLPLLSPHLPVIQC